MVDRGQRLALQLPGEEAQELKVEQHNERERGRRDRE